jgi:hypothetical protein
LLAIVLVVLAVPLVLVREAAKRRPSTGSDYWRGAADAGRRRWARPWEHGQAEAEHDEQEEGRRKDRA